MKDDPAFPCVKSSSGDYVDSPVNSVWSEGGLTKREHFAGLAMQGLCALSDDDGEFLGWPALAKQAVQCADALIAQLEKPND